ncbi:cyclase family protein [Sediminibacterium sp.]|uniref:cyclase family protein n=1 Tax=Sediminibacterium sp. TaxID=1917865 RepID=UPI0025E2CAD6|nr:cyclase family protein [Sediminibacterium sp.]MBW0177674.1 cyclase family protein [Sediminibacterium sp.]
MQPVFLSYFYEESTPVYGGKTDTISFIPNSSISKGDTANSVTINLPNHSGTHLDFPRHFSDDGKTCSDYPPAFWIFEKVGFLACNIEEVPTKIAELQTDIELLILKTGFGSKRNEEVYWSSQPVIPASFGPLLRAAFPQLRVFGFDLISLTSKLDRAEGKKAHLTFLIENDILVLEDMNLQDLTISPSKVIICPILIKDADGTPCTVIAF